MGFDLIRTCKFYDCFSLMKKKIIYGCARNSSQRLCQNIPKEMLTIILCRFAVEDLEHNDGTAEKPYFMNRELLKILGKKNEKYKELTEKVQPADKKAKKSESETTGV